MKIQMSAEKQELYKEMKRLAKRSNQRILRLERSVGKDSIGIRNLREKLSIEPLKAWTKTGRVKESKSFDETQMKAIIAALNQFNKSLYSTKTGLKKIRKKGIESIKMLVSDYPKEISYQEAEALYYLFEDKEVNSITEFIGGSDLIALIEDAREQDDGYDSFKHRVETIVTANKGKNFENLLKKVYLKYVYKGNRSKSQDIETVNKYIIDLINNAKYAEDLTEIREILKNQEQEFIINNREYNYLLNLIKEKENEILDGI